jgi:sugar phosphate isomerase/epimerase
MIQRHLLFTLLKREKIFTLPLDKGAVAMVTIPEMKNTNLNRRQFLARTAVASAALGMSSYSWAQAKREIPIAVQLYSVRGDCGKDFDDALAQVAKMGFTGVEFAGYYKYDPKNPDNAKLLRKKLDDLGLKAAATHIGTGSFRGDALKRTIDFHQTIGCKFLIVPGDGDFTNPDKYKALAETFNQTAEALKPLNMFCGYHNHTGEFKKNGDKSYYDLFAEGTSKEVVLQQDCGWTAAAGLDPVAMMKKYQGRMKSTHFKPTVLNGDKATKKAYLGQDSVDWVAVLAACREVGGTEWITVEQETYPDGKSAMECTALSLQGLKKIL